MNPSVSRVSRLSPVVEAEDDEDGEGAEAVRHHPPDRVPRALPGEGLGQVAELLERVAEQDQAEDLELLAGGDGDGVGDGEDEPHHLEGEEEREGGSHPGEVVGREARRERRGQEAPAPELDGDHRPDEDDHERRRHRPPRPRALPEGLDPVVRRRDPPAHGGTHATAGPRRKGARRRFPRVP